MKEWIRKHPNIWEFILFNVLSNCATIVNFVTMWFCTLFLFRGLSDVPFRFLIFDYTAAESQGLCGFLSFLTSTALAQTVNFFVQRNWVFKSDAAFAKAVPKYICLAVILVLISAALPAYSQRVFTGLGIPEGLVPTMANLLNIVVQIVLTYPAMKLWIMPKHTEKSTYAGKEAIQDRDHPDSVKNAKISS